jgi:hypothetical protein
MESSGSTIKDTTANEVSRVYEAVVELGASGDLGEHAARMRQEFQRRTGSFRAEDPWFETRSRAFWDDALAAQGFAELAKDELPERGRALAARMKSAHRGFFVVDEVSPEGACIVDLWSGAELYIRHLDDTQALTLEHAEGAMDARVVAVPDSASLYMLPGAYHHPADALDPAMTVLAAARERGMQTQEILDALMRMELVLRTSSRVKAGFAYRVESLSTVSSPRA